MTDILMEVYGWSGAVLLVLAYSLVTSGLVRPRGGPYQLMNALGAGCVGVNALNHGALAPAVLNAAWLGIAAVGLWKAAPERGQ